MVILAEELLLLAYDDQTGRNKVANLNHGLAGAMLLDLVLEQHVDLPGKHVTVTKAPPTGHPLLDQALQQIAQDKPRRPKAWVDKLHKDARGRIANGLASQGLLRHDVDRILGFIPFHRHLPVTGSDKSDARRRLEQLVTGRHTADARTAALGALVYAANMEKYAVPAHPRRITRRALKEVAKGSWAADATNKAIQATQAAVTAAVAAAAVTNGSS